MFPHVSKSDFFYDLYIKIFFKFENNVHEITYLIKLFDFIIFLNEILIPNQNRTKEWISFKIFIVEYCCIVSLYFVF